MSRNTSMIIRTAVGAALGSALLALTATSAEAQTAPAPTETGTGSGDNSTPLSEVIVTGTHIARTGFTAPNPVSVVDSQQIQNLSLTNVADVLAQLPQNSNLYTPMGAGPGANNFNTGGSFADLRGLNPFFGTRTLTLVDGNRVVPTSAGGSVDLNIIPSALVQRLETVTGGASAAYGSDAVAGVVNIIVDTKLEGFKAQADYGKTKYGDGDDTHLSLAYGTGFASNQGHFVFGAEYENTDSIGSCAQVRSWCASNDTEFTNGVPSVAPAPGTGANYIIGPNGKNTTATLAGVLYAPGASPFAPATLLGQFNGTGNALIPFDPGLYGGPTSISGARQGGDGAGVGVSDGDQLLPGVKYYSLFTHGTFDITDTLQAFTEGGFTRREADNYNSQLIPPPFTAIAPDNAFLSSAEAAEIPTGGDLYKAGNVFQGSDVPPFINSTRDTTWHVSAGLKGNLFAGWTWDGYVQYGHHEDYALLQNTPASANYSAAVNAVLTNPALPYNPVTNPAVCATPLPPGAQPGCQPLDLFGINGTAVNPAQAAAYAYAFPALVNDVTNTLKSAALNLHGDLYQGWGAGPIQAAVGGEFRRADLSTSHDIGQYPAYYQLFTTYGDPYSAKNTVEEGYAEVNVPILKDLPLAKSWSVDAAYRETHNSISGTIDQTLNPNVAVPGIVAESNSYTFDTWKFSTIWDSTDWLRVRATQSRDVRAPSFQETFNAEAFAPGAFGPVSNPNTGTTYFNTAVSLYANAGLNPETADTTTAGFVLSPSGWATGLQVSADWYQIKLHGAIGVLPSGAVGPAQAPVDACVTTGAYCYLINGGTFTQHSTAAITSVNDANLNLGLYTTRGADFEVGYHLPLLQIAPGLPGDLDFRVVASYVYDMIIAPGEGATVVNYAGQSGPAGGFSASYNASPKLQSNTFVTYNVGDFSGTLTWRYIGSGRYETFDGTNFVYSCGAATCPASSINNNHVDSASYFNLSLAYKVTKALQVFGRIDNLLNKTPPLDPSYGSATNPGLFDTLGMNFKVGVRLQY
jgi:iron complex outermembrane recepter protein